MTQTYRNHKQQEKIEKVKKRESLRDLWQAKEVGAFSCLALGFAHNVLLLKRASIHMSACFSRPSSEK
jgi:hypothetical protein